VGAAESKQLEALRIEAIISTNAPIFVSSTIRSQQVDEWRADSLSRLRPARMRRFVTGAPTLPFLMETSPCFPAQSRTTRTKLIGRRCSTMLESAILVIRAFAK